MPPTCDPASNTVQWCPAVAASRAATSPAGPAPRTSTSVIAHSLRSRGRPPARSRPPAGSARGFGARLGRGPPGQRSAASQHHQPHHGQRHVGSLERPMIRQHLGPQPVPRVGGLEEVDHQGSSPGRCLDHQPQPAERSEQRRRHQRSPQPRSTVDQCRQQDHGRREHRHHLPPRPPPAVHRQRHPGGDGPADGQGRHQDLPAGRSTPDHRRHGRDEQQVGRRPGDEAEFPIDQQPDQPAGPARIIRVPADHLELTVDEVVTGGVDRPAAVDPLVEHDVDHSGAGQHRCDQPDRSGGRHRRPAGARWALPGGARVGRSWGAVGAGVADRQPGDEDGGQRDVLHRQPRQSDDGCNRNRCRRNRNRYRRRRNRHRRLSRLGRPGRGSANARSGHGGDAQHHGEGGRHLGIDLVPVAHQRGER